MRNVLKILFKKTLVKRPYHGAFPLNEFGYPAGEKRRWIVYSIRAFVQPFVFSLAKQRATEPYVACRKGLIY